MHFKHVISQRMVNKLLAPILYPRAIFEAACRKLICVFNYHEICETPSNFAEDFQLNITPGTFRKQLKWIKKYFHVVDPNQLITNEMELPAALITFDDGFASTFHEGSSILKQEGLVATVFINMAPIKGDVFWSGLVGFLCNYNREFSRYIARRYPKSNRNAILYCKEKDLIDFDIHRNCPDVYDKARSYYGSFVSEEELAASFQDGIYLGNHLYNHYNAANLSIEELKGQYMLNECELKKYRNYINLFSYPFGQPGTCYSQRTDAAIFSLGAARIFTAFSLFNKNLESKRLHRISMFDYIADEESFKANCIFPSLFNRLFRVNKLSYV